MNFTFSEEQEELRRTIRRFCDEKSPSSEVRRLMETPEGYDPAVWKQMAGELGLQGLAIPESYGGQGASFIELGIVQEEFGRALMCSPLFASTCIAANAILNTATDEQKTELLPGIADGERIATLALAGPGGSWDAVACEAVSGRVTGETSYVLDGMNADTLIVAAVSDGAVGLYAVDATAEGVEREPLDTMDMTRKQARVVFDKAAGVRLGRTRDAADALAKTLQQAMVMLAAESAGGAQAALDMAVAYAKERHQFGRPIGQFQAIKHKCAEMLLRVESAKTAVYYAMWAAAEDNDELPVVSSLAKAYCTEAYFQVASDNIQVHGGIGFTWEHDAHLYYKRAKSSELLFGDPVEHREKIADRLGI